MNLLEEYSICCPYCGETITILVDKSVRQQEYTEDCEVCCRPMSIRTSMFEDGVVELTVQDENS